jgi:protein-S-isoprenylcysteine O-methyltransferase Ste14
MLLGWGVVMTWSELIAGVARFGPALFFTLVAVFYTVRILLLRRRRGESPVSYGVPGTPSHRIYRRFRMFRALIWLAAVTRALWPPFDAVLLPLSALDIPVVMAMGNVVMYAAFACIGWLNLQMGADWRSGAPDPGLGGALRTDGAFGLCRHPMLALVMAGQIGLFLAIPSVFTLLCLVIGMGALFQHAAIEEADLARRHGGRWTAYCATTPKWPWGRLRLPATALGRSIGRHATR